MRLIFDLVVLRLIATTLDVPITRFFEIFFLIFPDFRGCASKHHHLVIDDSHLSFENIAQTSQYPQCVVPGYIEYVFNSFCNFFEMLSVAFTHSAIAFVVKKEENFRTYLVIGS